MNERIEMMGCQIDNLTMDETLDRIGGFIRSGRLHQHVVVNVDKLVKARRDPQLRDIVNQCALVNVDGMPVVWASRLLGKPLKERVAGVDLFESLMARAPKEGWRIYLLGARPGVAEGVRDRYLGKYPGLNVVGARDGYWKPEDEEQVVAAVAAARPDVLFVAISSPKKEQFLARYQERMHVPFAMGVGGTFDVAVGKVSRAPRWMQRGGLEWFYRFLQEPRRLFRRYFVDDMAFIGLVWNEWRAGRAHPGAVRSGAAALPNEVAARDEKAEGMSGRPGRSRSAVLKAKVAIEALADGKAIAAVAQKHDAHPNPVADGAAARSSTGRPVCSAGR